MEVGGVCTFWNDPCPSKNPLEFPSQISKLVLSFSRPCVHVSRLLLSDFYKI